MYSNCESSCESEIKSVNLAVWQYLQLGGSEGGGALHESVGLLQQSTPAFGNFNEYETDDDELIL